MRYILPSIVSLLILFPTLRLFGQEPASAVVAETAPAEELQDTTGLSALIDSLPPVVLTYPQILIDMANVHVEQDSMVTLLMEEKIAGVQRNEQERPGYRVQVYSSNHPQRGKAEALLIEQRVKQAMNIPVYVLYTSPSWKVRLGNFLTEQQAAEFRDTFKALFPDIADYTYIVRDQIKVR